METTKQKSPELSMVLACSLPGSGLRGPLPCCVLCLQLFPRPSVWQTPVPRLLYLSITYRQE